MTGALAGIRIKFRPYQRGRVRGVRFEHIQIINPVAYAVDVYLESDHYEAGSEDESRSRRPGNQDFSLQHSPHGLPGTELAELKQNTVDPSSRAPNTVAVFNIKLYHIYGKLGHVPAAVCDRSKNSVCPRAVGRFTCSPEMPCSGIDLTDFNVEGFSASSEFPDPCTWSHAIGSTGGNVRPVSCRPPTALG